MLDPSSRAQPIHGILRFLDRAFLERQMVTAHSAVADAGEIKSKDHKTDRSQGTCHFYVNTSWSNPVNDTGIKQNHGRTKAVAVVDRRIGQNPYQGSAFPKKNSFLFHEGVLEIHETMDCNAGPGTSKPPSAVGSQMGGASRH